MLLSFRYVYFFSNWELVLKLIHIWECKIQFRFYDTTLRRDALIATATVMLSAILENGVLHLNFFSEFSSINSYQINSDVNNKPKFHQYFCHAFPRLYKIFGFNTAIALYATIQHKVQLYAWNFVDILIAVFARAIYFRFDKLNKCIALIQPGMISLNSDYNPNLIWEQAVSDHKMLTCLVDLMDEFFAPLIFGSYAVNMFYICIQVYC